MYKSILLAASLTFACCDAIAAPRALLPAESRIGFTVKQMGVPVSGEFKRFDAAIDFNPDKPETSSASLRIEIGSLTTGSDEADAIALDTEWLDKAHAPYATFKSSTIRTLGAGQYEARGTLNIRNKARDLIIRFDRNDQPGGKTAITGSFVIRRAEFGIGGGEWNAADLVAQEVPITVRLMLAPPAPASTGKKR